MNRYTIIRAGKEHILLINEMAQVVFRHTYRDILSCEQIEYMISWMYSPVNINRQMEEGHVYYVAFHGSCPSGYVSIQRHGTSNESRQLFHLHKLYVMPSEQGQGLGRILFDKALSHARTEAAGCPATVELNVNRNNPAISFYRHLGLNVLRQGDFSIGNGFYMNDYIMGIDSD